LSCRNIAPVRLDSTAIVRLFYDDRATGVESAAMGLATLRLITSSLLLLSGLRWNVDAQAVFNEDDDSAMSPIDRQFTSLSHHHDDPAHDEQVCHVRINATAICCTLTAWLPTQPQVI